MFKKASDVLCEYFDEIASIGLKNEFNINATNFLKNLVYYGKPRILSKRIIYIKNYDDIHELVTSFNSNFSKFGITVCEDDLKIECLHEKNKMNGDLISWKYKEWERESSDFTWKNDWCK